MYVHTTRIWTDTCPYRRYPLFSVFFEWQHFIHVVDDDVLNGGEESDGEKESLVEGHHQMDPENHNPRRRCRIHKTYRAVIADIMAGSHMKLIDPRSLQR